MALLSHSKLKTALSVGLSLTILGAAGCTTTVTPRYDDRSIYNNGNGSYKNQHKKYKKNKDYDIEDRIKRDSRYPAIRQLAIRKVTAMGYQVKDIDLDEKKNQPIFEIEAKRGGQEYEIELSYPDLRVIKLKKD